MNVVLWIVAVLLAAMFLLAGLMKIAMPKEKLVTSMQWARSWSRPQIQALGTAEVLGAAGLILPRALNIAPALTPLAAVGCAIIMAGATVVHTRMKDYKGLGVPVVLLVLSVVVAAGRF